MSRIETSIQVGAQADVLWTTGGASEVHGMTHHISERGSTCFAEVRLVEADAEHAAACGDLGGSGVGDLPVARNDRPCIAVRSHDRPTPLVKRIRNGVVSHVAQIEDHLLTLHRLEQLHAELSQSPRGASAAAVSGGTPCGADDAQPPIAPRGELRWRLHRV